MLKLYSHKIGLITYSMQTNTKLSITSLILMTSLQVINSQSSIIGLRSSRHFFNSRSLLEQRPRNQSKSKKILYTQSNNLSSLPTLTHSRIRNNTMTLWRKSSPRETMPPITRLRGLFQIEVSSKGLTGSHS